jgi:hypothetical protein
MDGKGRFLDNIFIERLWRSLKYEEVFIKAYGSVMEARRGIGAWLSFTMRSGRTRPWVTGRRAGCLMARPARLWPVPLLWRAAALPTSGQTWKKKEC